MKAILLAVILVLTLGSCNGASKVQRKDHIFKDLNLPGFNLVKDLQNPHDNTQRLQLRDTIRSILHKIGESF